MKTHNFEEIIKNAKELGACDLIDKAKSWKKLATLFFDMRCLEFCEKKDFPKRDFWTQNKEPFRKYGFHIDEGVVSMENPGNVAVIGNTNAKITVTDNSKVTKIILMHGGVAEIEAGNYSVLRVVNINGRYTVNNDGTSAILK